MGRSVRYAGIAAVATIWTALVTATVVARFDVLGEQPVSYLGSQPRSAALFTLALAGSAVLLTAFHGYVRDRFPVARGFSTAMLVGLAGQLVAAFVPIGGDPVLHRIHTSSALVLGASLPMLMWRFAAAQPAGTFRRASYALFRAEVAACAAGLCLSAASVAAVAEILPAVVFHVWVVAVTLARRQKTSSTGIVGPGRMETVSYSMSVTSS